MLEFFELCYQKGVKIALNTDTHELAEAGGFIRHYNLSLKFMNPSDIPDAVYQLPKPRQPDNSPKTVTVQRT